MWLPRSRTVLQGRRQNYDTDVEHNQEHYPGLCKMLIRCIKVMLYGKAFGVCRYLCRWSRGFNDEYYCFTGS